MKFSTLLVTSMFLGLASLGQASQSQLITNLNAGLNQTLVVYGTSLTQNGRWSDVTPGRGGLHDWLTGLYGSRITMINSGMAGKASNTGVASLSSMVLANNPDTVIIEFAINDAYTGYASNNIDYNISVAQSKANLNTMIDRILAAKPSTEIILQTMNPAIDVNGHFNGSSRPNLAAYYQNYRDVAATRGLMLIDHYVNWTYLQTNHLSQLQVDLPDGLHPIASASLAVTLPAIEKALLGSAAIPPVPTGLTATGGTGQVSLSWSTSSGAIDYNVKRATVSGGPYATVATGVTSTSYIDTGLVSSTTYYYVASAVNGFGESANSAEISTTTLGGSSQVAAPSFSPAAGSYSAALSVTIVTTTGGASIRYTTDGVTTPTSTVGTLYTGPVTISSTTTLQAIAYESGFIDSTVTSGTYTIGLSQVAAPSFSPAAGSYSAALSVTIVTTTSGASIRYTTDGMTTPTSTVGTVYTGPVSITATTTLKAIAYASGMTDSSVTSGTYTITAAGGLPSPWLTQDVGAVGVVGSASYSGGTFTVVGSGTDISRTADQFRYVYQTGGSNCTITARVASMTNPNSASKAGVMIRETLATGSSEVSMTVTPTNGVTWQYRSATDATTNGSRTAGLVAPYWVRVVRSGNTFTGYLSPDGVTWTQQGTTTITMASSVYIGLPVTSRNNGVTCTATFDNVTASP